MVDVDVLLPIRSPRASWLREALTSIESQRGVNARLVAVLHPDDAAWEEEIRRLGLPTEVVFAPRAGGIASALNAGLAACVAPLVARMDADDISEPSRLVCQCEEIETDPNCAVIASAVTLIDGSGRCIGTRRSPTTPADIEHRMRWKCAIAHPSVVFRREAVMEVGGYAPSMHRSEDYELWLRVLTRFTIRTVPMPLLRYRVHASQLTSSGPMSRQDAEAVLRARLQLAASKGESQSAARLRHAAWNGRQELRRMMWRAA